MGTGYVMGTFGHNKMHQDSHQRFTYQCLHVDGHKDTILAFKDLSLIEQLNVQCDSLAKLLMEGTY